MRLSLSLPDIGMSAPVHEQTQRESVPHKDYTQERPPSREKETSSLNTEGTRNRSLADAPIFDTKEQGLTRYVSR